MNGAIISNSSGRCGGTRTRGSADTVPLMIRGGELVIVLHAHTPYVEG
jgi:hypothetical protein